MPYDQEKYLTRKAFYLAAFEDIIARQTDASAEDEDAYCNAMEDLIDKLG